MTSNIVIILQENIVFEDLTITILHMTSYMSIIICLLYTGQMAENASNTLRQTLAKLYNYLLTSK